MKKYKGVVFFDYDGTTVDEVDEIKTATPTTVESLNKLKENGYLTMLCSGRTQRFLEMDIDKFMGAITCNGSHTEVEGEVIRDICIPDELVFQVVNEYFPRDTIIHFETRDISYYLHMDEEFFKNHCKLFNLPQRWYAPWKFRTKNTHISKLVMNYKDIQVKKDFEEEFKDVFTCAKHVRENFIDITLKGVTKGDAITELIEKLGIDKKDTYAFGDADNDVEMMQAVLDTQMITEKELDILQELIEKDPEVRPYFRVLMIENYNVSKAAKVIPAANISEQISLASKEASGTGNMKFMLNGALTLGTEDGANVEIRDLVGEENIYIFGRKPQDVIDLYEAGTYSSKEIYEEDALIHKLVDFITGEELLAIGDEESLTRLHRELIGKDWFMTLLDTKEYITIKEKVYADYEDRKTWNKKALINIAKAGFFSSDRTIAQYNEDIWKLK